MKKQILTLTAAFIAAASLAFAHEGHDAKPGDKDAAAKEAVTIKGEVVDMACYIDHGATGDKHADCAKKCINMGLPVGIKGEDGKTYLIIGEHKPINKDLADSAAKTITVRGKVSTRDGFNMIENAEIVK